MEKRFNAADFGLGLIIGLALGAIGGIILAPQSGEKTRKSLVNRAADIKTSSQELIESARHNLEQAAIRLEGVFGLQEKNLRKQLDAIKAELDKYDLGAENLESPS